MGAPRSPTPPSNAPAAELFKRELFVSMEPLFACRRLLQARPPVPMSAGGCCWRSGLRRSRHASADVQMYSDWCGPSATHAREDVAQKLPNGTLQRWRAVQLAEGAQISDEVGGGAVGILVSSERLASFLPPLSLIARTRCRRSDDSGDADVIIS